MPGLCAVVALALLAGCGGTSSENTIKLAGSTAFSPTADKLGKAYAATHPGVKIEVQSSGSMPGIKSAKDGTADVGMADVPKLPPEADGLTAHEIARDGVAVVVHPGNAVKALTTEQVAKIFTLQLTNWKDVGGADHEIHVVARDGNSGTRKSFDKLVGIDGKVPQTIKTLGSNGALRTLVAGDENAISYVSISLLDKSVHGVLIDGVEPTNLNTRDGKYKIQRPVYFLTRPDPKPAAKAFIDWVLSPEGQKIVAEEGLIPIK